MAKRTQKLDEVEREHILPLPRAFVEHHQPSLLALMRQWQEKRRIPPVWLISGPQGVGKRAIVHYLTQWLFCKEPGTLFIPCGKCLNCNKAIQGNLVDFTEIAPGDGEEGPLARASVTSATLKIDQLRSMKASIGFGAFEAAFKIILIRDADRMTTQAANSVLKILEEPPPGWIFFLTAADPALLPSTIVSRCQKLRLRPFSSAQLVDLLSDLKLSPQKSLICASLAQGSLEKARRLAADDTWAHRETLFRFLIKPEMELNALVDWASGDPNNFELLLNQLEQILADLISWSVADSETKTKYGFSRNPDCQGALLQHADTICHKLGSHKQARAFWSDQAERLFRARQEALAPLNRKILIQELLLPWLEMR